MTGVRSLSLTHDSWAAPVSYGSYHIGSDDEFPDPLNGMASCVMQHVYPITKRLGKFEYLGSHDRYDGAIDRDTGKRVIFP